MAEVIGVFGVILFGLLTISYGASIRGKTCAWKEGRQFWTNKNTKENNDGKDD
jgi:hypothetical protein